MNNLLSRGCGGVVTPGKLSWSGCAARCSKSISGQKCHFPHPFSDQTSKIHTRFQKSCHHYLGESATKKINSSNPSHIRIFLFISYSFGTETINTFVHPPSSLENHTRFQTKMGKIYTRFQTNKLYGYDKKKVLQYCKSYLKLIIDSF